MRVFNVCTLTILFSSGFANYSVSVCSHKFCISCMLEWCRWVELCVGWARLQVAGPGLPDVPEYQGQIRFMQGIAIIFFRTLCCIRL
jgi:hypothetical protein